MMDLRCFTKRSHANGFVEISFLTAEQNGALSMMLMQGESRIIIFFMVMLQLRNFPKCFGIWKFQIQMVGIRGTRAVKARYGSEIA